MTFKELDRMIGEKLDEIDDEILMDNFKAAEQEWQLLQIEDPDAATRIREENIAGFQRLMERMKEGRF